MDYRCLICNDLYPHVYPDSLEICATCYDKNFAGAQPPPTADAGTRDALNAYVDAHGPYTLTPRQAEAMSQLVAAWRREVEDARSALRPEGRSL